MKINKLIIENLGLIRGKIELDLSPQNNSNNLNPIILFGGLNGTGKTTLFEAIKLCLYGRSLYPKISNENYKQTLFDKIHYSKETQKKADYAKVEVEIEYSHFGVINTYNISRDWTQLSSTDSLKILKNGHKLEDLHEDYWNDFIKELVPFGLSELFFFDGEKIQKIMSGNSNKEFKESIRMLLGIDLIDRLKTDIKIYQTRNLKRKSEEKYRDEFNQLESSIEKLGKELSKKDDYLASINNDFLIAENKLNKYKDKISAQGGNFLVAKNEMSYSLKAIEKDISDLENSFRDIASSDFPVLITNKLCIKLLDQLNHEKEIHENEIVSAVLKEKSNKFIERIRTLLPESFSTESAKALIEKVTLEVNDIFNVDVKKSRDLLFNFSSHTRFEIQSTISNAENIKKEINQLKLEYETKHNELTKVRRSLNQSPEEELLKPMFEALISYTNNHSELKTKIEIVISEKHRIELDIAELERKKKSLLMKMNELAQIRTKLDLTMKTQIILDEYKYQLSLKKVSELERAFKLIFNQLHRKDDFINEVKIDPNTFEIELLDINGNRLVKNGLSSGEKEIYAISLIYALARVSGHKLPFIIDTPLGRLDTEHRGNLLTKFFPNASHQMIIFSTNTEIDRDSYNKLKNNISKEYKILYNEQKGFSTITGGYFWG